ncbi:MAG: VWA domain-containing protein [Gammaproteobacteria bacterium]|nr:VWA domain-containing protein [Gammaproteobacteria bacterium]
MARRQFNVFNLSFLDVMSCGLGAVVLFFMVINAQVASRANLANQELLAETNRIEEEVLDGRKKMVRVRNALESKREEQVKAEGEARRIQEMIRVIEEELAQLDQRSLAREDSIEDLMSDIKRLEEAKKRLSAQTDDPTPDTGQRIRTFIGDGNRQYLTGMKMGGQRVLILVDASTSMLGRTYVNVLRFRNMPDARKRRAPKWQQTIRTVDWLATQITPGTRFQIYTFNEQARSVLKDTDGEWLEVSDGSELEKAITALELVVPEKGSSLHAAFAAIRELDPLPDNIYLLTDGLPTQGKDVPGKVQKVKPERRSTFFQQAVKTLPRKVPVNVLLYPMDGDPAAPGLFWGLALSTRGSFLTPSRDWP